MKKLFSDISPVDIFVMVLIVVSFFAGVAVNQLAAVEDASVSKHTKPIVVDMGMR